MITLNDYFNAVIWIGSEHRTDRGAQMRAQLDRWNISAYRFEAHWKPIDHLGNPNGNFGCSASHRGVLELISHNCWHRTLVLEDDAVFVDDTWPEQFDAMIREVPEYWDFLFLGAGYAEDPVARVNGSFIRAGALMTTSSYGITYRQARKMAPHISGIGPIDSLYHEWQRKSVTLIFSPRLMVQRPSYSDLQEASADNSVSMMDRRHEEMV